MKHIKKVLSTLLIFCTLLARDPLPTTTINEAIRSLKGYIEKLQKFTPEEKIDLARDEAQFNLDILNASNADDLIFFLPTQSSPTSAMQKKAKRDYMQALKIRPELESIMKDKDSALKKGTALVAQKIKESQRSIKELERQLKYAKN